MKVKDKKSTGAHRLVLSDIAESDIDIINVLAGIAAQCDDTSLLKVKGWWQGNTKIEGINWTCIYLRKIDEGWEDLECFLSNAVLPHPEYGEYF
jgi:hypothetical protein